MNHRVGALAALLLGLAGCAHTGQQARLQAPEDDKEAEVKTVGDVTTFGNADSVSVMGVGLVVGLDGTGGGAPPGPYRTLLEEQLRKKGVSNVKEVLASPDVSLVLVAAEIPPGAAKDDRIDLTVTLPAQSQTKSLRGGTLKECLLYDYSTAKNVSPGYEGPDRWLRGHPVARGEGAVLVGFGDGDDEAKLRQGRVWGGGRCQVARPFYLLLNSNQQYAKLASVIADRINEAFQGPYRGTPGTELASPKNKEVVTLNVPSQYRHNLPRFLRVVRLVPLREGLGTLHENRLASSGKTGPGTPGHYRNRLEQDLLDPKKTISTALRLEALGNDSVPLLKRGLESEHTLVRFASAEALAYLNSPSCGDELTRAVEGQPALRAFALTALASMNEAVSYVKLTDLLRSRSAETRYGAFRALRALDERHAAVQGEKLNDSFWLHRVAPNSPGLVHVSSSRRAEVVLFGEDAELLPPFSILCGEFTVTANANEDKCLVSLVSLKNGVSRRTCPLRLEDVVRTMAELGSEYPDVVELVRNLDRCHGISCRVAVDALPQALSVYDLAKAGEGGETLITDEEIIAAKADIGATPTLFEQGSKRSRTEKQRDAEAALRDRKKVETR